MVVLRHRPSIAHHRSEPQLLARATNDLRTLLLACLQAQYHTPPTSKWMVQNSLALYQRNIALIKKDKRFLYIRLAKVFCDCKMSRFKTNEKTLSGHVYNERSLSLSTTSLFCYGSALARAALVPIGLGLASLGYLSMQCFLFPTSFLSFVQS